MGSQRVGPDLQDELYQKTIEYDTQHSVCITAQFPPWEAITISKVILQFCSTTFSHHVDF